MIGDLWSRARPTAAPPAQMQSGSEAADGPGASLCGQAIGAAGPRTPRQAAAEHTSTGFSRAPIYPESICMPKMSPCR